MNPEERRKLDSAYGLTEALSRFDKIPLKVKFALARVLNLRTYTRAVVSDKLASSEDRFVDENGTATYNVLKPPVGFLSVEINGATYQIPYYT